MAVLLHVSDPHFGTEVPQVVEALVTLAQAQSPDLVVLSGDITQRATASQFRQARACLDRLRVPCLAIPGNHDVPLFDLWSRLTRPYARYAVAFGAVLEPVHDQADLLVLGVKTTRRWRHKQGQVSAAQVDRVAHRLARATPSQLRVVVVHQPMAVSHPADRCHLLRGHEPALAVWSEAGADVVLGGHIHLPFVVQPSGLPRSTWVVQAGTAVSRRTRPGVPNSVNVLRWGGGVAGGVCLVERWDYQDASHTFVMAATHRIQPDRPGVVRGSAQGVVTSA